MVKLRHNESCIIIYLWSILARHLFKLNYRQTCMTNLSFVNWQWDKYYVIKLKVPEIFATVNSGHATHTGERVVVLLILVSQYHLLSRQASTQKYVAQQNNKVLFILSLIREIQLWIKLKVISLKKRKSEKLEFFSSNFQWILLKVIILSVKVACEELTKPFSGNLTQFKPFISHQK